MVPGDGEKNIFQLNPLQEGIPHTGKEGSSFLLTSGEEAGVMLVPLGVPPPSPPPLPFIIIPRRQPDGCSPAGGL